MVDPAHGGGGRTSEFAMVAAPVGGVAPGGAGAFGPPKSLRDGRPPAAYTSPMSEPETRPAESREGVDLTLIRWMLSLTPAERVEHIEGIARSLEELRELNRER